MKRLPILALLLTACGGPIDGEPLTQDGAVEALLDQVVVSEDVPAIVFAHDEPLSAGDVITPYLGIDPDAADNAVTVHSDAWFFWIDDAAGAAFSHDNRYALVEIETGDVTVVEQKWWPTLDGVGPWVTADAYWDPGNWVHDTLPDGFQPRAALVDQSLPALRTAKGHVLVFNGADPDENGFEDFGKAARDLKKMLGDAGFPTTYFADEMDTERDKDNSWNELEKGIKKQAAELGAGDTLIVYLNGHGFDSEKLNAGFIGGVWEDRLADALKKVDPAVNIVVVLDSCHSGSFLDSLKDVADVAITSTSAELIAWIDPDWEGDPDPEDKGMEFTSGLCGCLTKILADEELQKSVERLAENSGIDWWDAAFRKAAGWALDTDYGVRTGTTAPKIQSGNENTKPKDPPEEPAAQCTDPKYATSASLGAATCGDAVESTEDFEKRMCQAWLDALEGNKTDHSNGELETDAVEEVDLLLFGHSSCLEGSEIDINELYPCGEGSDGFTICADQYGTFPETESFEMFFTITAADIPIVDPSYFYQYGFVFDADGDPANNYVPYPDYPMDFFADTDLWYQVNQDGYGWTLTRTEMVDGYPTTTPSEARAVISGATTMLLVPKAEFVVEDPSFRVTSFRHHGDYGLQPPYDWSGDVQPTVDDGLAPW